VVIWPVELYEITVKTRDLAHSHGCLCDFSVQLVLVASQEAKAHDLIEKMQRVRHFGKAATPQKCSAFDGKTVRPPTMSESVI
jgi:hypothetical protein